MTSVLELLLISVCLLVACLVIKISYGPWKVCHTNPPKCQVILYESLILSLKFFCIIGPNNAKIGHFWIDISGQK